jgi:hypothetical protein
MPLVDTVLAAVAARGDLAHLALLVWAGAASLMAFRLLAEVSAAHRRFDDFVRELARFNHRHDGDPR